MASKNTLIVIAGIVWLAAGINILRLGIDAFVIYGGYVFHTFSTGRAVLLLIVLLVGACIIMSLFHAMFSKLVRKNVHRIADIEGERAIVFRFFNVRSYILMIAMMTFGILLRTSGIAPEWFIAFFYTGLGIALAFAGVCYFIHRTKGADWSFHHGGHPVAFHRG